MTLIRSPRRMVELRGAGQYAETEKEKWLIRCPLERFMIIAFLFQLFDMETLWRMSRISGYFYQREIVFELHEYPIIKMS